MSQQGDVVLCQTNDDGEISVVAGVVEMSGGLSTSVYLSMFGGNEDDGGEQNSSANWWGNIDETIAERQYRSETQYLLQGIPATSANLRRIEDAAVRDLQWMLNLNIASSITVSAVIPALNRVKLIIDIEAVGEESRFEFVENWKVAP